MWEYLLLWILIMLCSSTQVDRSQKIWFLYQIPRYYTDQPHPEETLSTIFVHIVILWMKPHCWLQVLKYQPNTLGPTKPCSMLQCLFDENLPSTLRNYHKSWFFLCGGVTWVTGAMKWTCFQFPTVACWENPQDYFGMRFLIRVGMSCKGPLKILRKLRMSCIVMFLKAFWSGPAC